MRDGIEKGHGKCMTMGLGIGVLPYLWLLKDEVESVTIVEFNQDVIDLFEKYIRPQFKTHKKLEIIHGNAFDYYKVEFLNQFDYVYVDF
jgi:spermidine synthase